MDLVRSAQVFASNALWRTTGMRPAGRTLVRALSSDDENVKTIAGMFLVQAGEKAEPLLREALARRESLPTVLTILGDIGDRRVEPELQQFVGDPDQDVARAAQDALLVLARQH